MRSRGRISAFLLSLVFLLQGACFLSRPGLNQGETHAVALKGWLLQALFAICRPGPKPLRMATLIVGAVTVFFAMRVMSRCAGEAAALAGGVLLATDSAFLMSSRLDSSQVSLSILLSAVAGWAFLRFWRQASRASLAAAFLSAGLAISDRPDAAWIWIALAASAVVVFRAEIASAWAPRNAVPALSALAIGLTPLLLARGRAAVAPPPWRFGQPSWWDYAIRTRPGTWGIGPRNTLERLCAGFAHAFGNPRITPLGAAFAVALVASAASLPWLRRHPGYRPMAFGVLTMAIALAALGAFGLLTTDRVMLLTPWPHLVLAIALTALARRWIVGIAFAIATISVLALSGIAATASYLSGALLFGGTPPWTEAIYGVAANLDVHDAPRIRILSPGIAGPLEFLRGGQAPLVESGFNEETLFIARVGLDGQRSMDDLAKTTGKRPRIVSLVQDEQGRAMFALFRLE